MTASTDKSKGGNLSITRLQALRLRRIPLRDLLLMVLVAGIGMATVWAGQMAGLHMTPPGAAGTSKMLDELQLPRRLPNLPVERDDGVQLLLWDLIPDHRALLTVYAPWCPACQRELPVLHEALSGTGNLIVLIARNQKRADVDDKLANLGLSGLHYYRDVSGEIMNTGKVASLPTTFLIKDFGKVLDRLVGYSDYRLHRLIKRAKAVPNERNE